MAVGEEEKGAEQIFQGVCRIPDPRKSGRQSLATKNLTPGRSYYGESLIKVRYGGASVEFRLWDPYRSKLAAAILNRLKSFPFKEGESCLYLGASTGTTVSHVSDVLGSSGHIFAVELAPRVARELLENVAKYRRNVIPIIADARHPDKYGAVYGEVHSVYCDIAQADQTEIAILNCRSYIGKNSTLMLVVKASSIDVLKPKDQVFAEQKRTLEGAGFEVTEQIDLEPFDRNHALLVAKMG
ncbi:MAG TPA: fibrillarin-like rRNA/tRNA 2'-O-methyltransferase [Nitrososphaerales archaeon]|nr:fibrillarin-like rRNA/tRNA 2'-O-methyltransferase [Nitrososphaerales archaeon]